MRFFVLFILLGCLSVGCASSTSQKRVHEGPSTPIGTAPEGDEARVMPIPAGPAVMTTQRTSSSHRGGDAGPGELTISRAQLDAFIAQGPAFAFSQVETQPHHADGSFVGFQLVDVTTAAHNHIAPHLRVGDIVTHVNGIRLQRPDDYLQAWRGLAEASSVRIDFRRDGEGAHVIWQVR
jgi:type II secretory pathway component PulC